MIKKLRNKFIIITMTTVFAVLLLIIIVINAVNIYQNTQSIDSITEFLLFNDGSFHDIKTNYGIQDSYKYKVKLKKQLRNKDELAFSTRFFSVILADNHEIISYDLSSIASVTDDDVEAIVMDILSENENTGWYNNYRYRIGETENGKYMLVAMEASGVQSSILSVLGITFCVGLGAFLLVFIIVALLSKRAIQPVSEAFEKQKQFVTDASHELKTPLTVIAANTEVLNMTYGENEWSNGIIRQSEYMRALIGQMIQMAKLDEGIRSPEFNHFNLSEAVYDTAMSFHSVAASKDLSLTVNICSDIFMDGDEAAIRQLVSILVDNAVKYCDVGGNIKVDLSKGTRRIEKKKAYICVSNTFSGVDTLDTTRIFERFYRADKARTSNNSYGLGLSIAKAIAENHKGKIMVRRTQSKEIIFTVVL